MALIPSFFLDCVVALGVKNEKGDMTWIGTGFLWGNFIEDIDHKSMYRIFLVTNKHVLDNQIDVWARFNPLGNEHSKDYRIILKGEKGNCLWVGHDNPDIDVAVIGLNTDYLNKENRRYSFFHSNKHVLSVGQLKEKEFSEGDSVFVLGFPMGLVNLNRQYVICKTGCIARLRDLLDNQGKEFLIDCSIFPGNSGGPVLSKPELISINGTKSHPESNLIGMIKSYLPYQDVAISLQTKRPRVVFEENSGLAAVVPVDFIYQTIDKSIRNTEVLEKTQ